MKEISRQLYDEMRPLFDRIYYTVGGAVDEYFDILKQIPRLALSRTVRGACNQIFDLMRLRAHEAFADLAGSGYRVVDQYDSLLIRMPTKRFIRFNKLNKESRVHRPNTHRSEELYYQRGLFDIGALEDRVLTAGYGLDLSRSALAGVLLQCQLGDLIEWSISIPRGDFRVGIERSGNNPSDEPSFIVEPRNGAEKNRKAE